MFQHNQVFTRTAVAKQSVETCGKIFYEKDLFNPSQENIQRREIFFWTKDQRKLIEGNPKRVLFTSNFGTGKTLVMRAKAMHLGKKRHRFVLKNQAAQETLTDHENTSQTPKANLHGSKGHNRNNPSDPGKIFIILFTKPDALLYHSIHQEFEELKDHVEVCCSTG